MTNNLPILAVASFETTRGSGHLVRSSVLVGALNAAGRSASLFISGDRTIEAALGIVGDDIKQYIIESGVIEATRWAFIIVDRYATPGEEFLRFQKLAPLLGIDEGGEFRHFFDFLIDLLPLPEKSGAPNLLLTNFLTMPVNRKPSPFAANGEGSNEAKTALISFGGEDSAGLTPRTASVFSELTTIKTTVLRGAFARNLRETLVNYDLVVTHFGLTAFESIYAGVPVMIVSPTKYHEELARSAGFYSAGVNDRGIKKLEALLQNGMSDELFSKIRERCKTVARKYRLDTKQQTTLPGFINTLEPAAQVKCPVCGALHGLFKIVTSSCCCGGAVAGRESNAPNALARFNDRTYCICGKCKIIYMKRLAPPETEYSDTYFFEDYKKQYGKTYLEDFPNLRLLAAQRLRAIKFLMRKKLAASRSTFSGIQLLDIGCAYGAFLAEAKKNNFDVTGIDPSKGAIKYINNTLNLKADRGFFPLEIPARFDVITMWYVIEHFENPAPALQKVYELLKPGGIFAFSTPSSSGVSGRSFLQEFLKKSPADHWTIWSPRHIKKQLRPYHFSVRKIIVSGHHGERFPIIGAYLQKHRGVLYRFCMLVSRIFKLGDTFEVYAVKSDTVA
jgi:2-polyprenyl-3-methyl-5-hydroxy-6-metoxy-1,4-benzoquinol methylase/spore coat polysaccharide biosynthesis predicted glycosyltransferase SpsG